MYPNYPKIPTNHTKGGLNMLLGQFEYSLDAKGRVFIPAKLKDSLGETFVLAKSMDPCIAIYSKEMWEKYVSKLSELPAMKTRAIHRFVFSTAIEANTDSQGRVLITQPLREYAGLEKEVTIIGNGDHAEIWNTAKYNEYMNSQSIDEMVDTLMEYGF
ncbi:MAG: division/cell wall cluster transcriptional repressor MraZ [Ruminococcaceae bacterium]|nr:division/cell wall cluster transcriptional repressor MraZ [Oscillospiraceae bacterium]